MGFLSPNFLFTGQSVGHSSNVQVAQKVLESLKESHTCGLNLDFQSLKTCTPVPSDPIIKEIVGNALHECRHLLLPHM